MVIARVSIYGKELWLPGLPRTTRLYSRPSRFPNPTSSSNGVSNAPKQCLARETLPRRSLHSAARVVRCGRHAEACPLIDISNSPARSTFPWQICSFAGATPLRAQPCRTSSTRFKTHSRNSESPKSPTSLGQNALLCGRAAGSFRFPGPSSFIPSSSRTESRSSPGRTASYIGERSRSKASMCWKNSACFAATSKTPPVHATELPLLASMTG